MVDNQLIYYIQELVQVESLAQVGVQLLLFTLGLEFSLQKLKAVRNVALIGLFPLLLALHIFFQKSTPQNPGVCHAEATTVHSLAFIHSCLLLLALKHNGKTEWKTQ